MTIDKSLIKNNQPYAFDTTSFAFIALNSVFMNNGFNVNTINYLLNNTFIKCNKLNFSSSYISVLVNNIFDPNETLLDFNSDAKISNNYVNYSQIEDNGNNIIFKNNLESLTVGELHLADENKAPLVNSPVIDKGLNPNSEDFKKIIPFSLMTLLETDMLGNKRVHNSTIDIGAIEYGSTK
jgi:hypothetical protein